MPDEELEEQEEEQVYEQEVLIDDSSFNAIATAIRRKNGLARTYKPREMAPAIRAVLAEAPSTREYTITVIQSDHLTIKVKLYLGGEKMYSESFTVSEPYWKARATIEADPGYTAGALNYPDEITIDRDYTISASPAELITYDDPEDVYFYVKGNTREDCGSSHKFFFYNLSDTYNYGIPLVYEDSNLTQKSNYLHSTGRPYLICHFIDRNERRTLCMNYLFGAGDHWATISRLPMAKEIVQDINTSGVIELTHILYNADYLEYIDLSNWDVSSCENMSSFMYGCPRLKSIGNISYWNPVKLRNATDFLGSLGSREITSLDVSGWNTPELRTANNFVGGNVVILDISNWDTTNLTSFSFTSTMKYLIMDKEEIKFSGGLKCPHPNNTMKYLVPESMVLLYKLHPNWSNWASLIDSVTNYTINRANGLITVVPNY